MYFLARETLGVASSVCEVRGRFLTGRRNVLKNTALIECELEPFADLGLAVKNACLAEQNGIICIQGYHRIGIMQVVGVAILLADRARRFSRLPAVLCNGKHNTNGEKENKVPEHDLQRNIGLQS